MPTCHFLVTGGVTKILLPKKVYSGFLAIKAGFSLIVLFGFYTTVLSWPSIFFLLILATSLTIKYLLGLKGITQKKPSALKAVGCFDPMFAVRRDGLGTFGDETA